jgi:hypothetical protein
MLRFFGMLGLLLALAAGSLPCLAGRAITQGPPTDGKPKAYENFSICWPKGYQMRADGARQDDRVYYSIGNETENELIALRVDTMPITGLAGMFSEAKVIEVAEARVLKQMRKDFPNLQPHAGQQQVIGGEPFHGSVLRGSVPERNLGVEVKLFFNKRGAKLYIISVVEVSRKPGEQIAQISHTLDSFRFPKPHPPTPK